MVSGQTSRLEVGSAFAVSRRASQKQTLRGVRPMSALPPKADMDQQGRDVRFVPEAEVNGYLRTPTSL
jgi:hypothetical protein